MERFKVLLFARVFVLLNISKEIQVKLINASKVVEKSYVIFFNCLDYVELVLS